MASATTSSFKPVSEYVDRLQKREEERIMVEERATTARKQREENSRRAEIQNSSELTSQLRQMPVSGHEVSEDGKKSPTSIQPRQWQQAAELECRALRTSPHQSEDDYYATSTVLGQSRSKSSLGNGHSQLIYLENQLAVQSSRIKELEASCDTLGEEIKDLRLKREEAETSHLKAIIAGKEANEAKKEQEDIVATLKTRIEELMEQRRKAEDEIEDLRNRNRILLRDLAKARGDLALLEPLSEESGALVNSDIVHSRPLSVAGSSMKHASVDGSEERRRSHRRSSSGVSQLNVELNLFKIGSNKERKKSEEVKSRESDREKKKEKKEKKKEGQDEKQKDKGLEKDKKKKNNQK